MGSRPRIRWHKAAKLALGAFGCLALFLGLPSLIRRPEPPPLEPDIGLAALAASGEPARWGKRPRPTPKRRGTTGGDRRRHGTRSEHRRRPVAARHPTRREAAPSSSPSPVAGVSAPAPAPAPVPLPAAAAPPAPPPPTAPAPAQAPSSPVAAASEFGFER